MSNILGVKFRDAGQIYYFASGPFVVAPGDSVIVNTEQGYGLASVVLVRDDLPEDAEVEEVKPIYRVAAQDDLEKQEENLELAKEAFSFCRTCVHERELDMKLVDVEVFFDRSKIIFYFTAPNRIDFRELVKDLVRNYRTRIELRQIGVRHETQMIGAVGNCGQVCCCRRFLRKFAPVTIRMAKEQNLFLNPTKISGICGRLLCCLSYEQSNYEDFHRNCPKIGKKYTTTEGPVKVLRANLFRNSLSIIKDGGEEKEVTLDDWLQMSPRRPDPNQEQQPPSRKNDSVDQEEILSIEDEASAPDSIFGIAPAQPPRPAVDNGKQEAQVPGKDKKQAHEPPNAQDASAQRGKKAEQASDAPASSKQEGNGGRSKDAGGAEQKPQRKSPRSRSRGGKPSQSKAKQPPQSAGAQEQSKGTKPKRKRRRKPKPKQSQ